MKSFPGMSSLASTAPVLWAGGRGGSGGGAAAESAGECHSLTAH